MRLARASPSIEALADGGIAEPFRIQSLVIPDALTGSDVLAKSPTGSGKTLAFAIPIVERIAADGAQPTALVLVPTRELALQVADELEKLAGAKGLRVAVVYGGAPVHKQGKAAKGAQILVATPGRLQDLMDRRLIAVENVSILVLDEADRMLDMGFRPQVEKILRRAAAASGRRCSSRPRSTARSASSPARTRATRAASRPSGPCPRTATPSSAHTFVSVTNDDKLDRLIELLEADRELALVFVRTKRGADRLAEKLQRRGVPAVAMHGDMTQPAREKALERFRSGSATTLVATDVAARGLDLDDISHVINFDPPEDDKGYVHRVGRTGRAGRAGQGITLVLPEQQAEMSRVAARLGHRDQFESTGMKTARPKLLYTSRRGRNSRW